jgi:hypothetical protein
MKLSKVKNLIKESIKLLKEQNQDVSTYWLDTTTLLPNFEAWASIGIYPTETDPVGGDGNLAGCNQIYFGGFIDGSPYDHFGTPEWLSMLNNLPPDHSLQCIIYGRNSGGGTVDGIGGLGTYCGDMIMGVEQNIEGTPSQTFGPSLLINGCLYHSFSESGTVAHMIEYLNWNEGNFQLGGITSWGYWMENVAGYVDDSTEAGMNGFASYNWSFSFSSEETKYTCTLCDGCQEDPNGVFNSLDECQTSGCVETLEDYAISIGITPGTPGVDGTIMSAEDQYCIKCDAGSWPNDVAARCECCNTQYTYDPETNTTTYDSGQVGIPPTSEPNVSPIKDPKKGEDPGKAPLTKNNRLIRRALQERFQKLANIKKRG